jgi:hypothetical protein
MHSSAVNATCDNVNFSVDLQANTPKSSHDTRGFDKVQQYFAASHRSCEANLSDDNSSALPALRVVCTACTDYPLKHLSWIH